MRIVISSLIVTAGLVLALELLSSVSQLSAPDIRVVTENPTPGLADSGDGTNALITCIVPPPAVADEVMGDDRACGPSADHGLSMEIQMTEC